MQWRFFHGERTMSAKKIQVILGTKEPPVRPEATLEIKNRFRQLAMSRFRLEGGKVLRAATAASSLVFCGESAGE
jgi:hypothetical protein